MAFWKTKHNGYVLQMCIYPPSCAFAFWGELGTKKFKMLFLYYIKIIQGFTMIHLNGKLWLTLVEMLLCDSAKMFLTSKFWVTRLTFFPTPPIKLKLRLQVVWSIEYMFHTCCIIFSHHTISLSLLYSRSVIIDAFLAYQEVLWQLLSLLPSRGLSYNINFGLIPILLYFLGFPKCPLHCAIWQDKKPLVQCHFSIGLKCPLSLPPLIFFTMFY